MAETILKPKTMRRRLVSFVLPVYDEQENLRELYRQIVAVMDTREDDYELIFVDDGSKDGSYGILQDLHAEDDRVRVVRLRRNFGKAAAYSAGFDHARGEVVITMDTDLQDDPAEIPLFLDEIDRGFDMVVGWKHEGKGPVEKRLPSKFFNRVVRSMTGIELHDFNCPFKAYRREVLEEIEVYGELHRYIPVLASSRGFSIGEVKIKNLPRLHGRSKYGIERYLRGMLDLLTIQFITRFASRPMHLLGLGGIICLAFGAAVVGFFIGAHFLYELGFLLDDSWVIHDRPALNLGILVLIVGVQFFATGLLGELYVRAHQSTRSERRYSVRELLETSEVDRGDEPGR